MCEQRAWLIGRGVHRLSGIADEFQFIEMEYRRQHDDRFEEDDQDTEQFQDNTRLDQISDADVAVGQDHRVRWCRWKSHGEHSRCFEPSPAYLWVT